MGKKKSRKRSSKKGKSKFSKQQKSNSSKSHKLPFIVIALIVAVIGSYFFYTNYLRATTPDMTALDVQQGNASGGKSKAPLSDNKVKRGGESRPTLRPSLFRGKIARAYKIAQENRDLIDSIYCYCHCKVNFGHKSLLTCYVDNHAERCDICLNQATNAYTLHKKGFEVAHVRNVIDQKFWRPFR